MTRTVGFVERTLEQQRDAHLYAPPPNLMGRVDRMTPELNNLLAWALAKDPNQRPRSAGEWAALVKTAVERATQGYPSIPPAPAMPREGATPVSPAQPGNDDGISGPLLVMLVILVMVAAALAAIVSQGGL